MAVCSPPLPLFTATPCSPCIGGGCMLGMGWLPTPPCPCAWGDSPLPLWTWCVWVRQGLAVAIHHFHSLQQR